jgi:hypothetical protein
MRRALTATLALFVALLFLGACAQLSAPFKRDYSDMSDAEKATWMLSTYNDQYDAYQADAGKLTLSEAQKEYLRGKKRVLEEVYPLMMDYAEYVKTGKVPSASLEKNILDKFERLGVYLGGM